MLKRIVVITFVALLSLGLAGTSIAETKRHSHPATVSTNQSGMSDPNQQWQQIMQQATGQL